MSLDLEKDDMSQPPEESEDDDWISLIEWISESVRSDAEIILLEAEIINANTDLEPITWINLYAEKFRKIVTEHPEYTIFQIKYALYVWYHE